ncbi:helix-turn-helix transcriptional regulator [Rubritalea tangerina]|uniref:Helix-turn-helix transcriptional regulator n=2 Tax=Rubritalea tangerina TaxID=430798 RepID=A0ABW4Z7A9_9BACT
MISDTEASAIVRLLGNTAALEGGHSEKKRFLMNGLCELIGADAWVWSLGTWQEEGAPPVYVGIMHQGFDEERYAKLLKVFEHPHNKAIVAPWVDEVAVEGKHATYSLEQLDKQHLFSDSEVAQLMSEADIGELFVSGFPVDAHSMSAIGMYRSTGKPAFSEREMKIAHLLIQEIPWLHSAGWPNEITAKGPQLYPQQRVVLNLMLDGLGRKQISHEMELAENTVAGYIKDIYRHFGVSSHAQLMSKFLVGNSLA